MNVLAIIQARMTSTRLPKKVMLPIAGKPMLQHIVERVALTEVDELVMACTTRPEDDVIVEWCGPNPGHRGSEHDVLGRFYDTVRLYSGDRADAIVRITSDCPMIDPAIINTCIDEFEKGGYDYFGTSHPERTVPRGFDVEVFSADALAYAHFATLGMSEPARARCREHVTPFMYSQSGMRCGTYRPPKPIDLTGLPNFSIDTREDYERVKRIIEAMPDGYSMYDVLARPDLW